MEHSSRPGVKLNLMNGALVQATPKPQAREQWANKLEFLLAVAGTSSAWGMCGGFLTCATRMEGVSANLYFILFSGVYSKFLSYIS